MHALFKDFRYTTLITSEFMSVALFLRVVKAKRTLQQGSKDVSFTGTRN